MFYGFFFLNRMVSFGVEDFANRYGGLKPSQFADMIALSGDRSDNIPGYFVLLYLYGLFPKSRGIK